MTLALPDYLRRQSFADCPPGHRFGLYFDGWTDACGLPRNGKTGAFKQVADNLPEHSRKALAALAGRQFQQAAALGEQVLIHPATLTAPLATGLGNEHPLENGFAFLNPHGLPYLPGSGAKGAIRRAAEELASGEWGGSSGWSQPAIDALFGPGEEQLGPGAALWRGALAFWDVFFLPPKGRGALAVEIMTPHHAGYLQGSGSPHANESPNPIPFLAVPAGARCRFVVQAHPALIRDERLRATWKALLAAALEHAGEWLGFGAKSSVGYGRLAPDRKALAAAEEDARQRRESAERQRREAELGPRLTALARFIEDCQAKAANRRDKLQTGLHQRGQILAREALAEGSAWTDAEKRALAEALEEWLPRVVERLDRKDDWKDARKKLRIAELKGAG